MKQEFLSGVLAMTLLLAGCGTKTVDVAEAEKNLADAEKQLQVAKAQAGAAQRVDDLEKKLSEAKSDLAASKGEVSAPAAARTPAPPREFLLPAGTPIRVRTTTSISTKTSSTGSTFEASLMDPLTVDGVVLAPAGAAATGVVLSSDDGGKVKGKASISVAIKSITTTHGPLAVQTNSRMAVARSNVKRDVVRGGIMTGAGAAIGAIAGGGKGAAIGAGVGGGAGVGTAMATKGEAAMFPPESILAFTLRAPATLTVQR